VLCKTQLEVPIHHPTGCDYNRIDEFENRSKHQNYVSPHDEAAYRDYNPNWLLTD